ncbi:hypothetical protein BpHYR1_024408 [Brachionus plicatilis]|uniref:Uncharacterized protein n=1 Tax=Brachionus plicatilis TaxID=10195 RepID=A0A3M7QW94_BRAPC|nr:hypothetical protein BpHYR1_024408 [Brachionus plicatilis]
MGQLNKRVPDGQAEQLNAELFINLHQLRNAKLKCVGAIIQFKHNLTIPEDYSLNLISRRIMIFILRFAFKKAIIYNSIRRSIIRADNISTNLLD